MRPKGLRTWSWLLFPAALAAGLEFTALGSRGDLDGHEALAAQTAREMLESGDWIVPTFCGADRFEKPPLAYWLAALYYWSIGTVSEFTARLPSATSAVGLVLCASVFTSLHFGRRAGLAAGFTTATSYWVVAYGKLAVVDATLSFLTALAVFAGHRVFVLANGSWTCPLLFWCACGMTTLAKGPAAWGVIFPTLLLSSRRRPHPSGTASKELDAGSKSTSAHALGLCVFLALSASWPCAVLCRRPEALSTWVDQSLVRYAVHYGPQTRGAAYYFWMAPLLALPWTPWFLIRLTRRCRQRRWGNATERTLWIWFAAGMAFFSASAGKREHYILPALTPLAILAGLEASRQKWFRRWTPNWKVGATAVVLATAGAWLIDVNVRSRHRTDSELHRMIERQRDRLEAAAMTAVLGTNDRAIGFRINRPMTWLQGDVPVGRQLEAMTPIPDLLLVRFREEVVDPGVGVEIDRCPRKGRKHKPAGFWVLYKVKK